METAAQWAAGETFKDCEANINQTVRHFQAEHGGDWNELFSQAQECFLKAYRTYDPLCGTEFKTWLYSKIWYGLHEVHRQRHGRNNNRPAELSLSNNLTSKQPWSVNQLMKELTTDARLVLRLAVMETQQDLRLMRLPKPGERFPTYVRRFLTAVLADFGWSMSRIRESFGEIREALR